MDFLPLVIWAIGYPVGCIYEMDVKMKHGKSYEDYKAESVEIGAKIYAGGIVLFMVTGIFS